MSDQHSSSLRTRLAAVLSVLLVVGAACGWGLAVRYRSEAHPPVIPAGQAWRQPSGASVRLVAWTVGASPKDSVGRALPSSAGTTWVLATVSFDPAADDVQCDFVLRGTSDHQWEREVAGVTTSHPTTCSGTSTRLVDVLAAVPNRYLGDVRGVGFRDVKGWTQAPILVHA